MSFNIEHWYPLLGPTRTAETTFIPITASVTGCLISLYEQFNSGVLREEDIRARLLQEAEIAKVVGELQGLIQEGGSFMKTSARSCKDVAVKICLKERYHSLLTAEVKTTGQKIDDMRLRSLFMEAGRQVLKFHDSLDFLAACVMSHRIHGVPVSHTDRLIGQDLKRGLEDSLQSPLSFVVREWMPSCPPELVFPIFPWNIRANCKEFRCFVADGKLTGITQYFPTIYFPALVEKFQEVRAGIILYFAEEIQRPLSILYKSYAVDVVLLNFEWKEKWRFRVIEVNPFFELTGEGLFESNDGREIIHGRANVEYPVMKVQTQRLVDPTERDLLCIRRAVEKELAVQAIVEV